MQLKRKIFNNRLSNHFDNLGGLVTGITKDINEISGLVLSMEKYGTQINGLKKEISNTKNETISLGKTPTPTP